MRATPAADRAKTVTALYAAFAQGDLPAVLATFADDAQVTFAARPVQGVPWMGAFRGHTEIQRFFETLAKELDFHALQVVGLVAQGEHVVARVHVEETVRRTGRLLVDDHVHWWTLGSDGKVRTMTHFLDTQQAAEASVRSS